MIVCRFHDWNIKQVQYEMHLSYVVTGNLKLDYIFFSQYYFTKFEEFIQFFLFVAKLREEA